jgi:nitroimidazol reductase NimA-like FMN-containing flavoprotein (pyridoxamine 5'-phosphate oxidase superfamily)
MAAPETTAGEESKATILAILAENRIMSLATLRADDWPQVTLVGYAHDDLTLYCTVGRSSQKLANIARNPRVSVAIGHDEPRRLRGLSMSGKAAPVTDMEEIERLNRVIAGRYPEQTIFAPRETSCAVLRITPKLVSIIDLAKTPGLPSLVEVVSETVVRHVDSQQADAIMRESAAPQVPRI